MSAPDYPLNQGVGMTGTGTTAETDTNLVETARDDLGSLGHEVKQQAAQIGEEVKNQAMQIGEQAKAQIGQVAEQAKGMVTEQKDLLVGQIEGVSSALSRVASELEMSNQPAARYARFVADGAERVTNSLRSSSVDDLIHIAQDFGRRQPLVFMGVAALLGFAASRFIMASSQRQSEQNMSEGYDGLSSGSTGSGYGAGSSTYGETSPSYASSVGGTDAGI